MQLPLQLRQACVDFLLEACGEQIMSPHGQQRLIEQSGLPRGIVAQILMGGPPMQFATLLIAVLCEFPLDPHEPEPLLIFFHSLSERILEKYRPQLERLQQQLGNEQPITPPQPVIPPISESIPSPPPSTPSVTSSLQDELQRTIVEFLSALPDIAMPEQQQALLKVAQLGPKLQWQIQVGGEPQGFSMMLVATLKAYGRLDDGRDPVEAILKASKSLIPEQMQADCDRLIQQSQTGGSL